MGKRAAVGVTLAIAMLHPIQGRAEDAAADAGTACTQPANRDRALKLREITERPMKAQIGFDPATASAPIVASWST